MASQPSAEAVALFRQCVAIEKVAGAAEDWEPVGRRREYLDAAHALHSSKVLPLRSSAVSPFLKPEPMVKSADKPKSIHCEPYQRKDASNSNFAPR